MEFLYKIGSDPSPILGLFSVGLTGDMLRGLMAGLDRELDMLLSDEYAAEYERSCEYDIPKLSLVKHSINEINVKSVKRLKFKKKKRMKFLYIYISRNSVHFFHFSLNEYIERSVHII